MHADLAARLCAALTDQAEPHRGVIAFDVKRDDQGRATQLLPEYAQVVGVPIELVPIRDADGLMTRIVCVYGDDNEKASLQ